MIVITDNNFTSIAGCSTKADVTFVLDSSDTVGQTNFAKQLNFVKNTVNNLDVGRDKVRISTVTFSSGVHNQFFLNNYDTKANVMNAVSGIQYLPGSTDTSDALKYVTQTSFTPQHGGRGGIPHIMVLVTDGPSITRDITKLQAQTAKDNNIAIYTVGVGHGIDMDELKSVSSDPDSRYLLTADNYDSLGSLSELLATKMCNGKFCIYKIFSFTCPRNLFTLNGTGNCHLIVNYKMRCIERTFF